MSEMTQQDGGNVGRNAWWIPLLAVALISLWAPVLWSLMALVLGGPDFGQLLQDWDYGIVWLWWPSSYLGGLVFTTTAWLLWRVADAGAILSVFLSVLLLFLVLFLSMLGLYGYGCIGCSAHNARDSTEAAKWIGPFVAGASFPMWLHLAGVLILRRLRKLWRGVPTP